MSPSADCDLENSYQARAALPVVHAFSPVRGNSANMPDIPGALTAALHREQDWYITQCLEVDVASQGHAIDEALANLAEAVEVYLEVLSLVVWG